MHTKQTKTRALLISMLIVLLCVAVIMGATFALFSAKKDYSIGVSTGKIDVQGELSFDSTQNPVAWSKAQATSLKTPAKQNGEAYTFTNGGTVQLTGEGTDKNGIQFENMMLGDGAAFKIDITNKSSVNMKYAVYLNLEAGSAEASKTLANSLSVKNGDVAVTVSEAATPLQDWTVVKNGETIDTLYFTIELPWEAQSQLDSLTDAPSLTMTITIEAVQANAATQEIAIGGKAYDTLAEAMQGATENQTISLGDTGSSTVTWPTANELKELGDKQVTIVGSGKSATTITPAESSETIIVPKNVKVQDVTLNGDVELPVATPESETNIVDTTITGNVKIGVSDISSMALTTATNGTYTFDGVTFNGRISAKNAAVTIINSTLKYYGGTGKIGVLVNGGSLHLANNTFEIEAQNAFQMKGGANVTIESGSYTTLNASSSIVLGATLTINGGVFNHNGTCQIFESYDNSTIVVNGGTFKSENVGFAIFGNTSLTFAGGNLEAKSFCIANNGNNKAACSVTISGGTMSTGADCVALYAPAQCDLSITNATITGGSILDMRMGTATISNSTLHSTNSVWEALAYPETSGQSNTDGSAFILNTNRYVDQTTGKPNDPGSISFTLGENVTINAASGRIATVYEWNDVENQLDGEQQVEIDFGSYESELASIGYCRYENGKVEVLHVMGANDCYTTIAKAIEAGETALTIVASNETAEKVTIPGTVTLTVAKGVVYQASITVAAGATLTVTGEGTLHGVSGHTVTNNGTLIFDGDVTVDSTAGSGCSAILNNVGATATLNGGTFTNAASNGYYVLTNYGTMSIYDGVTVTLEGKASSMIENGWYYGNQNSAKADAVLTIYGGLFEGGLNTVKNDDWGVITIKDGSFVNFQQSVVMNWNVCRLEGGLYRAGVEATALMGNGYLNDTMDKGELYISKNIVNESEVPLMSYNGGASSAGTITVETAEFLTAAANINLNKTVKLGCDIDLGTQGSTATGLAIVDKTVTIDFNGYTLNYIGSAFALVIDGNKANVTLVDTSAEQDGGVYGGKGGNNQALRIENGATVVINAGVYNVGPDAKNLGNSCVSIASTAKVTVNGGTFASEASYAGRYYVLNVQQTTGAKGYFTVYGGTFVGQNPEEGDDAIGENYLAEGYTVEVTPGENGAPDTYTVVKQA